MSAEPIPEQDPGPLTGPTTPPAAEPIAPPADAPVGTPTEGIAEPVAEPVVEPVPETTGETVVDPPATPVVPVEPAVASAATPVVRPSRRARATAVARRVLSFALMTALLVLGVAIGYSAFVVNQPAPQVVGDPATRDVPTPPSVQEFVVALRLDDEDAIRAALPPDPYKQYTAEMQNWSFQEVTSVETLSTFADGPRAATQLVLVGLNTDGLPVTINLTVVTDGGAIVMFR